jgi:phosphate transport system ATP-binding protein
MQNQLSRTELKEEKHVMLNVQEKRVTPIHEKSIPILTVKDLNVYYGNNHAIKHVSIPIAKHAVTALIGPSGCGKSTFLRTMNRMNDLISGAKSEGEILYDDVNLLERNIDVVALRKEIGMVFQKPNPFLKSIYENVAYGPKVQGVKGKKRLNDIVEKSLRDAALWDEVKDRLNSSAYGLSGGQQQRLCIARCLAVQPNVLLMDEPTSALDPVSTYKIEELVRELKKELTIVIVTHNMQQAARISDHTAFFLNGEVIEMSETEKLFSSPSDKRTEDYISGKFG